VPPKTEEKLTQRRKGAKKIPFATRSLKHKHNSYWASIINHGLFLAASVILL
jgi:hypothetical protein